MSTITFLNYNKDSLDNSNIHKFTDTTHHFLISGDKELRIDVELTPYTLSMFNSEINLISKWFIVNDNHRYNYMNVYFFDNDIFNDYVAIFKTEEVKTLYNDVTEKITELFLDSPYFYFENKVIVTYDSGKGNQRKEEKIEKIFYYEYYYRISKIFTDDTYKKYVQNKYINNINFL
jgi:hypothetical protein